jgi:hypothetical protein
MSGAFPTITHSLQGAASVTDDGIGKKNLETSF